MSSMGIQLLPQQLVPLMPILDAMSDGVLVVDASGSIIAVNKSMRRFYQGGETPFPGYPLADFNAADWVEAKRVLTSGKPLLGQTMHLPAATVVANRLPILQNGKVAGVVCAMQEISSLDAVVRQLGAYRELDSQLKGLLEALPQAVLVTDAEGRILRVNAPCCRLCAMERDSLQGRNVRELENVIERAVLLTRGNSLNLHLNVRQSRLLPTLNEDSALRSSMAQLLHPTTPENDEEERQRIVQVLRETNGIVAGPRGAATRLGMKRTTLLSRMQRLGISVREVL